MNSHNIKNLAISDNGFVFNPITGDTFNLNPIGLFIVQKLKENIDINNIAQMIYEKYEVSQDIAEYDLQNFIDQLVSYNIIKR